MDVQIAIAKFFDGEGPDPVAEARAAQAAPPARPAGRREVLLDDGLDGEDSPRSSASSVDTVPRIVPQPEHRTLYKPPFLLALLLTPVHLLTRILVGSLGLLGYLFPFLPRLFASLAGRGPTRGARRPRTTTTGRRPLPPRDTAARFLREFGEEYGEHALPFVEDGYAQAFDRARRDLAYLLVLLVSPEHDDTAAFVRGTLLAPDVQALLSDPTQHLLLWAGSVQDAEAYQVARALHCTKFPFAALVAHRATNTSSTTTSSSSSSSTMTVLARLAGALPPTAFLAQLRAAMAEHAPALDRQRAARAEQAATRSLREEQTSAYERSLARDRERLQQRRAAAAAEAQAAAAARARAASGMVRT